MNKLLAIDPVIAQMTMLTALNLAENALLSLPDGIGGCDRMTYLNLSHNRISSLPDSLGGLTGLTLLALEDNRMKRMPSFLKQMMKLQELGLNDNELVDVGADVKMSDDFVLEPNEAEYKRMIKTMSMTQAELLSKILDAVSPVLTVLRLDNNQLLKWGRWMANATSLTMLSLDCNNNIATFPSGTTALVNLKALSSRSNRIAQLPLHIGELTALEALHLDRNRIEFVPVSLQRLSALRRLTLAHNLIRGAWTFFPISRLPLLEELRLMGNLLDFPPQVRCNPRPPMLNP
jgi:Leucine-rich repeat (LRR) protein